jgi:CRISPR-associated protein Csy1
METEEQHDLSVAQIREAVNSFLQERLQPKLDKLKEGDEENRQKLLEAHHAPNWIADAAHRVGQIQQVTHALKYIHPEAKGTNLNSPGNPDVDELLIGTHTSPDHCPPDVVGNAAALDVYKFLRLEVDGKTLLSRAAERDPSLKAVFSSDDEEALDWMESFATLAESKGIPSSHKMAKQFYWPLGEGTYHLLAPLFPTSLVHHIWSSIREDRFSEEAKAAREARRKVEAYVHGYREYPNVVVQQFGGTKPQNISQLNSERYGENYLLPSLPPVWRNEPVKAPLRAESVFDGWFGRRSRVRDLVRTLRGFLYSVENVEGNIRIRNKRKELVGYLIDELLLFSAELHGLEHSWSLREECKLNIDERCWLDPGRATTDEEFAAIYSRGDWIDSVGGRFSNWLNSRLVDAKKPLPFGEAEAREWKTELTDMLQMEFE